ncbi:DUF3618 domain-containing protein [Prauserella flavalba]|uniref:DUF3618 domain-containing protein n=1 Tax=Prauserella flavalba TaxID=1477506 RepID=A0A318LF46_9PSEU|nr:DUF3618 domain-containing protein [Prauserella flavalba]PXY24469.1 hypothetical protein BA062_30140 [Prauserella flavalba]
MSTPKESPKESPEESEEFPRSPEEARVDIELTRQELGDTAQALAHKLNVPARAKEQAQQRAAQVKGQAQQRATQVKGQLKHGTAKATEIVRGNPVPFIVSGAVVAVAVGGVITWKVRH